MRNLHVSHVAEFAIENCLMLSIGKSMKRQVAKGLCATRSETKNLKKSMKMIKVMLFHFL